MPTIDDVIVPTGYDDPSTFLSAPLMQQQEALSRRKALLQAQALDAAKGAGLFAQPALPEQGQGFRSAVTGAQILGAQPRANVLGQLTPMLARARMGTDENALDADTTGYQRVEQAAAAEHMRRRPPDSATEQEKLQWATVGARIPSLKPTMDQYVTDQIVKAPERAEARAERQQTRTDARVEAQRKQAEELEYRRQRDQEQAELRRDLANQQNDLRRDLHAAVRASSAAAGGDKASDYQIVQSDDGTVYRVGKKPGAPAEPVAGVAGKKGGTFAKDELESRDSIERSQTAISEAPRAKQLLLQGSSSGLRADIRRAGSYVAPSVFGGKAQQADEALKPIGDLYVKSVPRFSGPTSDGDRKDYAAAAGQVANTNLPPATRAAALDEVVRLHQKAILQQQARATTSAPPTSDTSPSGEPPLRQTIRNAVKAAQPRSIDDLVNHYDRR